MRRVPGWVVAGALGQAACTFLFPFGDGGSAGKRECLPALPTVTAQTVVDLETLQPPPPGGEVIEPSTGVAIVRITEANDARAFSHGPMRPQRSAFSLDNEWLLLFRTEDRVETPVLYSFDPETLEAHEVRDLPPGSPCYATDAVWSHVEPGVLLCHFGDQLDRYDVGRDDLSPIATEVPDALGRNLYSVVTSDDDEVFAFTGEEETDALAFVVEAGPPPRSWTSRADGGAVGDVLPTPDGRSAVVRRGGQVHAWDFRTGGDPLAWMPDTVAYLSVADDFLIGHDSDDGGALVRVEIGGDGTRRSLAELLASNRRDRTSSPWGASLVHHDDRWALATVLADRDADGLLPWAGLVLAIGTDPDRPFASPLLHHRGATIPAIPSYDGRFVVFTSRWAGFDDVYVAALPRICE